MPQAHDLDALLRLLQPTAERAERHAWLRLWMDWVRGHGGGGRGGDDQGPQASVDRVLLFLDAVNARPDRAADLRQWCLALLREGDASILLADLGFAPRTALLSELGQRLKWHCLPLSPDTADLAEVFRYLQPSLHDAQWMRAIDHRVAQAWHTVWAADAHDAQCLQQLWHGAVLEAISMGVSQIAAAGHASEIRLRMDRALLIDQPFDRLGECLAAARRSPDADTTQALLAALDACSLAAQSVYAHLEMHGISVGIVFRLRQLRRRIARTALLIEALPHPAPIRTAQPSGSTEPCRGFVPVVAHLAQEAHDTRSIRALLRSTTGLLAERIAERNAHSGEHYITRNSAEYRQMLRAAAGGGVVIGGTTWLKFSLMAWALSPFWSGLAAGMNYAASFVLVMLLHFTVATKQPAVTAPAMALKLKHLQNESQVHAFVDEVAHLLRSQVASILGNLVAVVPTVLGVSALLRYASGEPMITADQAQYVLHSIDLWGPTTAFAAFTGVLLFASSLIAGAAENWFVLNRLGSAIAHQPRLRAWLGVRRAAACGQWLRDHVSGLAANVSLGLLLGLVPVVAQFMGLPLDVRHVTLSAGQLSAAVASLGPELLRESAFWWAAAGVAAIGPINLGVSFFLAFRVALASQGVTVPQRQRIRAAIWQRVRQSPLSFVRPPSELPKML